jgi:putative ATPase
MVQCPICQKDVQADAINEHLDSGCQLGLAPETTSTSNPPANIQAWGNSGLSGFFNPTSTSGTKSATPAKQTTQATLKDSSSTQAPQSAARRSPQLSVPPQNGIKRKPDADESRSSGATLPGDNGELPTPKRSKPNHLQASAPLADRMRPRTLDEVFGQELVGREGILRGLIEQDRVPSMILWGGSGTGKTTIARLVAQTAGCRFVEINSTSSGVNECKKLFAEARNELGLTGRKTILFCDEIHRFSKSQQVGIPDIKVSTLLICLIGCLFGSSGDWADHSYRSDYREPELQSRWSFIVSMSNFYFGQAHG